MFNPFKSGASVNLGLLLTRLPIGCFFLIAGYQKVFNMGVGQFVDFAVKNGSAPRVVPADWVHTYLHAIPYLEMAIGAMLILGLFARIGGLVGALMILSYIIGYTGFRGDLTSLPFHPNFIYLGLLLAVLMVGPGHMSLDGMLFAKRRSPISSS